MVAPQHTVTTSDPLIPHTYYSCHREPIVLNWGHKFGTFIHSVNLGGSGDGRGTVTSETTNMDEHFYPQNRTKITPMKYLFALESPDLNEKIVIHLKIIIPNYRLT